MTVKTRLAIVEDNASARIHLRSHLLALGNLEIFSFSNGQELKTTLRTTSIDIVLFDFHLGQHKNGVEWALSLQKSGLLKPSTGIIFITSDQTPQTLGQIIDLQPDCIILKPYTIRTIKHTVEQYLALRKQTLPVLESMDKGDHVSALKLLDGMITDKSLQRIGINLLKLKGKILLSLSQFDQALDLYQTVLKRSDKVIWARWGLIKCLFMQGDWRECQKLISQLLDINLTKNKAFEWLACMSLEENDYAQAENWLDFIQPSELTLQATRLKTLTYQMLDRADDAIDLLERKRQNAMSVKEHREELTFELADFYIRYAATLSNQERADNLYKARCLIGNAGRNTGDQQVHQRRDYLLGLANLLEGEVSRTQRLLENEWMHNFSRSEVPTMLVAAQVWDGVGDKERAQTILQECEQKIVKLNDYVEQTFSQNQLIASEQLVGSPNETAIKYNQYGLESFIKGSTTKALHQFYTAYRLVDDVPAFALNLLQCMVDAKVSNFKGIYTLELCAALDKQALSEANLLRLRDLQAKISQAKAVFIPPPNQFSDALEESAVPLI